MNTIDTTAGTQSGRMEGTLGTEAARQTLGQEDFFALMIAQLQNQDPTQPVDGSEYLGQLAQFNAATGVQELNDSMVQVTQSLQSLGALQAASLVGRNVVLRDGTSATVQSVTIAPGGQGMTVNLDSGLTGNLADIQEIF